MAACGRGHPSFEMTPTFQKKSKKTYTCSTSHTKHLEDFADPAHFPITKPSHQHSTYLFGLRNLNSQVSISHLPTQIWTLFGFYKYVRIFGRSIIIFWFFWYTVRGPSGPQLQIALEMGGILCSINVFISNTSYVNNMLIIIYLHNLHVHSYLIYITGMLIK